MNQQELKSFFTFCEDNLKGFEVRDCDESQHFYLNDEFIGGWAGDSRAFFYEQNDSMAKALRMMDGANSSGSMI